MNCGSITRATQLESSSPLRDSRLCSEVSARARAELDLYRGGQCPPGHSARHSSLCVPDPPSGSSIRIALVSWAFPRAANWQRSQARATTPALQPRRIRSTRRARGRAFRSCCTRRFPRVSNRRKQHRPPCCSPGPTMDLRSPRVWPISILRSAAPVLPPSCTSTMERATASEFARAIRAPLPNGRSAYWNGSVSGE